MNFSNEMQKESSNDPLLRDLRTAECSFKPNRMFSMEYTGESKSGLLFNKKD